MADTFSLRGAKTMQRRMVSIAKRFPDKVERALRIEAEHIMTRSKRDFVPVDLGSLRSSGHVGDVKRSGKNVEVSLTFGGTSAPYALAVHEHPSQYSPPSWQGKSASSINWNPSGRGPKYLQKPFNEAKKGMAERIGKAVEP